MTIPYQVDLKVEVDSTSAYRPNNGAAINGFGVDGNFGEINLGGRSASDFPVENAAPGTRNEATFVFTLIDHDLGTPMQVRYCLLTTYLLLTTQYKYYYSVQVLLLIRHPGAGK